MGSVSFPPLVPRPSPLRHPLFTIHYPLITLLLLAGCSRGIDTLYGQRKGPGASDSVNGTAVLGDLFERAGHRVSSWHMLSPRLQRRADCIVWFPDDFEPPSPEICRWLDDWLTDEPGRTLIYVGRDFDAEPWYWEHVLPDAPPEQQPLVRKRLNTAKQDFALARGRLEAKDCAWFTIDPSRPVRQVRSLAGRRTWLEGIDASKAQIELRSRISPPKDADVLLKSGKDVLVSRQRRDDGRLILVANGSFLLNLPLVNHEHRKLAGKLIAEIGEPGKNVVFLESDRGGPPIRDKDPTAATPTGFEMFNLWPTNWILLHLAVVGVIFCFSRWPIFGRPNGRDVAGRSDFGRHVDALADLLKRSRDRSYATARIINYRQKTGQEK